MNGYDEIAELKPFLRDYVETISGRNRKGQYICPVCGSGRKRHKTPALTIYNDTAFYCFSCGTAGDIFTLISKVENVDFKTALQRAREMYGGRIPPVTETEQRVAAEPTPYLYKEYIMRCRAAAAETDYFAARGFDDAAVKRFSLGYDSERRGIVIPYGLTYSYYLRRSVDEKAFYKPPAQEAGPEPIYNVASLNKPEPCFVCESPIDAMSIMSVSDCRAIAIGGVGIEKLIRRIDEKGIRAPLILSLDDDEGRDRNPGMEMAAKLAGQLTVRRIPFMLADWSKEKYPEGQRKDPNEMLLSNKEAFTADIKRMVSETDAEAIVEGYLMKRVSFKNSWRGHTFTGREISDLLNDREIEFRHKGKMVRGRLAEEGGIWEFKTTDGK